VIIIKTLIYKLIKIMQFQNHSPECLEYLRQQTQEYSDYGYLLPLECIPVCAICEQMYHEAKNDTSKVLAPHALCGCLWYQWFKTKCVSKNQTIKFVRTK
jgi:hypothetical protein